MIKNTWVNLPVKSLKDSVVFFEGLGFKFKDQFGSTNIILGDSVMVTLVEEPQFKDFAQKEAADTKTTAEAVLVLQIESRDAVNELVDKAISLGAKETRKPHEHGPMFGRSFEDLDGHVWEVFFMDDDQISETD